ncbi:NAD-dependent epimerase/dehydratase family protein [Compostibacter hankyongensis]|uniref:NAD-dependent epimerase/dehydratase family protein n=1 Tax=Compostibacter hankyongensis TaxID=1007089 RepID=A0ABP8G0J1_9BACT
MILVTGGTGFLGSALIQSLLETGQPLRCICRQKPADLSASTAGGVDWRQGDLLDVDSLTAAMEGVDRVFHCAGMVSFQPGDRDRMQAVNVSGTANVVNTALVCGIKKLMHVSSVAAIGRAVSGKTINEHCKWEDSPHNAAYAKSKYLAEMEVWRGIGEGLNAVIVNPSVILGPAGDWRSGSAALVQNAFDEFPWYTCGINGFVDLRDVVRAMLLLMDSGITAERFILNGDNWSYRQLFTAMAQALGKQPPSREAKPWMGALVWRWEKIKSLFTGSAPLLTRETAHTAQLKVYYDNSKIQQFLPDFRFTPLEETVRYTCEAYLKGG